MKDESYCYFFVSFFHLNVFFFFFKNYKLYISNYVLEKLWLNKQHNEESSVHKKDRQEKKLDKEKTENMDSQ